MKHFNICIADNKNSPINDIIEQGGTNIWGDEECYALLCAFGCLPLWDTCQRTGKRYAIIDRRLLSGMAPSLLNIVANPHN